MPALSGVSTKRDIVRVANGKPTRNRPLTTSAPGARSGGRRRSHTSAGSEPESGKNTLAIVRSAAVLPDPLRPIKP